MTADGSIGIVFNLQKYSLHDGPGIRTTVFLKGCPLCCPWCHNPEGLASGPQVGVREQACMACGECREACPFGGSIPGSGRLPPDPDPCTRCGACVDACPTGAREMIGRRMTVDEVMREVMRDRMLYEDSGGGVTLSGGEPLVQPAFVTALLEALAAARVHAALDTTGFATTEHLLAAARRARLVLYDLKAYDEDRHRRLTGVSNRGILRNLVALDDVAVDLWIRVPVIPGYTDDPTELDRIAEFVAGRRRVRQVNLLPFHRAGLGKYRRLGLEPETAANEIRPPTPEVMEDFAGRFRRRGIEVRLGG